MDEGRSSWNTIYQSKDGFEYQITLGGENETNLVNRAKKVIASIKKSRGTPLRRRDYIPENNTATTKEEVKGKAKTREAGEDLC